MADGSRRRLFSRRGTAATPSPEAAQAPTAAPEIKSPEIESPEIESPEIESPEIESREVVPAVRPAGPRGERTVTVAVRLTPTEHARWVAAAASAGRGQVGRWTRETVHRQLNGRAAPSAFSVEAAGEVAALRAELSKVGSNLNQVARALNTANRGGEPAPAIEVVLQAVEATRTKLGRVRDQLNEQAGR